MVGGKAVGGRVSAREGLATMRFAKSRTSLGGTTWLIAKEARVLAAWAVASLDAMVALWSAVVAQPNDASELASLLCEASSAGDLHPSKLLFIDAASASWSLASKKPNDASESQYSLSAPSSAVTKTSFKEYSPSSPRTACISCTRYRGPQYTHSSQISPRKTSIASRSYTMSPFAIQKTTLASTTSPPVSIFSLKKVVRFRPTCLAALLSSRNITSSKATCVVMLSSHVWMAESVAEGEGVDGKLEAMTARGAASIADFLVVVDRKLKRGIILIVGLFS